MKKTAKKRTTATTATSLALTAGLLVLPGVYQTSKAQGKAATENSTTARERGVGGLHKSGWKFSEKFIKIRDQVSVAGVEKGSTVFSNSKGEYFTVDPNTGDFKFLSSDMFLKLEYLKYEGARFVVKGNVSGRFTIKLKSNLQIVGVDKAGNTLMKNSQGETFYLDPLTGDFIFEK